MVWTGSVHAHAGWLLWCVWGGAVLSLSLSLLQSTALYSCHEPVKSGHTGQQLAAAVVVDVPT